MDEQIPPIIDQPYAPPAAHLGMPPPPAGTPAATPTGLNLLIGIALIWVFELILGIALVIVAGPRGPLEEFPLGILVTTVLGFGFTFAVVLYFTCLRPRKSLSEGLALKMAGAPAMALSVGIGIAAAIAAAFLMENFSTGESFMAKLASTKVGLAVVCILALSAPPFEEMYYRGFIFPVLQRNLGGALGVILVALWFTIPHTLQLIGDWIGIPVILALGFIWTLQRHITGSLLPSLVCHWVYNAGLVVISLLTHEPPQ